MPKVRDVMAEGSPAVAPTASIAEVAGLMRESGAAQIAVCNQGKFRGIVSERDIVTGVVAGGRDPETVSAADLLSNDFPIISPGADMLEAVRLMTKRGVFVLPVAQNGAFLGLITLDDIMRQSRAFGAMVLCGNRN